MHNSPMKGRGHRTLIWIEGEAADCQALAQSLLQSIPPAAIGWIDSSTDNTRQFLGQTISAGVINAHNGLDPDALGRLTGAIHGGGYCLLLSPPARRWVTLPDPGLQPILSHGFDLSDCRTLFIERLCRLLEASPAVRRLPASHPLQALDPLSAPEASVTEQGIELTDCQQYAVDAITALCRETPPTGQLLITADRGRGKSSAMGVALSQMPDIRVRLTAMSRRAASVVLQHAGDAAPVFLAPEQVTPDDSPLLIDEAAALPMGVVERLVKENPCCILSSTVHGYEGSGHGLTLRLARRLATASGSFTPLTLNEPVRWANDDPLEALINQILLLDAEPAPTPEVHPLAPVDITALSPATLADDEALLREAFGLLVTGHYRTRPRDLRQLLDDPAVRCWRATAAQGGTRGLVAARVEGGFDHHLAQAIHAGKRRPAGHLIAQSLTFHCGILKAAGQRGLRIQRIAVHPDDQRRGHGTALVAAVLKTAAAEDLDWVGTSFGYTQELLEFWLACGFMPVRFGHRKDPRSGAQAIIMLKAISSDGARVLQAARATLAEQPS